MPTNLSIIAFNKIALITPTLVDNGGNLINWDLAVSDLHASAIWGDLQNAQSFGVFTVLANSKVEFTATAPGSFTVSCIITYKEPISGLNNFVHGLLTITVPSDFTYDIVVSYTPFMVNVSANWNNRLTKDTNGALYVPEVITDLVEFYTMSKIEL